MDRSDIKLNGPYEVQILVHVTDGRRNGKITVNLSMGRAPTKAEVDETLATAKANAAENGLRFMDKVEFLNSLIAERTGVSPGIACPGGADWDSE